MLMIAGRRPSLGCMVPTALLDDLRAALGADAVLTDPDLLRMHQRDEADLCAAGIPLVVTRPRNTEQVVAVVQAAARHGVPVVPQGARTGLAGAANAVDGAVVLSTVAMNEIREIDPVSRIAVVQPGVVNAALAGAVAKQGLWYPPDPGSWESSTIGGNVATNAGGMCCVKYGVTTEYVLGLEVVLASGEVLRTGRRTAKGVAGYDLTRLFVGSEGTLGVITEVTVALRPAPADSLTLVAVFGSIAEAGAAVAEIAARGLTPSLLELLDQTHLRAIEAYQPMGLRTDAQALLLAAADTGTRAADDLAVLAEVCEAVGADEVYAATDAMEAAALLQARRLAHPAMEKFAADAYPGGNGGLVIDDVAVPRGRARRAPGRGRTDRGRVRGADRGGRARRGRQHAPEHRGRPGRPGERGAGPAGLRRDHAARPGPGRHVHRRARGGAAQAGLAGPGDRAGRRPGASGDQVGARPGRPAQPGQGPLTAGGCPSGRGRGGDAVDRLRQRLPAAVSP